VKYKIEKIYIPKHAGHVIRTMVRSSLSPQACFAFDPGKSGRTGTVNNSLMIVQADIVTKTAQLREGERGLQS
jgi:hypothetical protein